MTRTLSLTLRTLVLTLGPALAPLSVAAAKPRTVMVHLFEWKWNDVARECQQFLGPKGFSAVQVSPPNEHAILQEQPWYQRYQPVSYKLESRSGTRVEFEQMVATCKKSGVDIYVDAVINHMTGVLPEGANAIGSAGTPYSHFSYADYSYRDFHHCGRNSDDSIRNYSDRWEVQNCQLVNLADLNTESLPVQTRIAEYLKDLVNIGVAGFRIDAAKHMASDSVGKILSQVPGRPYVYQEVIDQGSEPISSREYFGNGDVTEFRYSLDLGRVFKSGQLAWLNGDHALGEEWGYIPSDKAIVFLDNHDNQRGHGGGGQVLTHKEPQLYQLAAVFMLAWPYGYPQLMSSYTFNSPAQGPPSDADGRTKNVSCLNPGQIAQGANGWVCEHRWPMIANMVEFRNVTDSEFRITNWWTNGANRIAFGRGKLGFVVINNEDSDLDERLQTGLDAGTYCNVVIDDSCKQRIEVDGNGKARFVLKPKAAAAIHIGKKTTL